jgi:hypothetical protein
MYNHIASAIPLVHPSAHMNFTLFCGGKLWLYKIYD